MNAIRPVHFVHLPILLLLLNGCMIGPAIPISPAQAKFSSEDVLIRYDEPKLPLIRISQFVDKRPERERNGEEPERHYMLFYYWREGSVVTSDKAWIGSGASSVPAAVASSLEQAVQASNYFLRISRENSSEPSGGGGIILKGEIQSLYAEQEFKHSGLFLILFWNSLKQYGNPQGHCKLNYVLTDAATGRELHSGSVEAESSQSTISESGAAALALAETRLTNDVTRFLKSERPERPAAR